MELVDADVYFADRKVKPDDREGARLLGMTDEQFRQRKMMYDVTTVNAPELPAGKEDRQLVGVDGEWYDITAFIPHHPGGDVIKQYVGRDATDVFWAYHAEDVLAKRRPCGKYTQVVSDPATVEYRALAKKFLREGWYETNYTWVAGKMLVCAALFAAVWGLVLYPFGGDPSTQRLVQLLVAAPTLAIFWQQCGFFMHDFMHNNTFHDRVTDQWLGTFFGTVCFGISGSWWRDEHNVHHVLTNAWKVGYWGAALSLLLKPLCVFGGWVGW